MAEKRGKKDHNLGVFSTPFETSSGGVKQARKIYWSARVVDGATIEVQPLNRNMIPTGAPKRIEKKNFIKQFTHEPDFFVQTPELKAKLARKPGVAKVAIDRSDFYTRKDPTSGAKILERKINSALNQSLALMRQGKVRQAEEILRRILRSSGPFEEDHKHTFNGAGISLRKRKRYDLAVLFYKKALEIDQSDENTYHNCARAYFELGNVKQAMDYLKLSLVINPDLEESKMFLRFLEKNFFTSEKDKNTGLITFAD